MPITPLLTHIDSSAAVGLVVITSTNAYTSSAMAGHGRAVSLRTPGRASVRMLQTYQLCYSSRPSIPGAELQSWRTGDAMALP
ncbi:uncharacterized protein PSFLO_05881 [Pseudozyma flocculosa]|uniref:Uncharacterized protein n=1 Tax=Pseudozyma flocculosa TaxID=84751 RepID=A0A5C3FAR0_9BASI|nr:uncharacterized protein PSFLO_05881 [Pseudozyma flocculosa]